MQDHQNHPHMPSKRDFVRTIFTGGFLLWIGAFLYPVYRYLKPRVEEDTSNAVQSVVAGKATDFDKTRSKLIKFGTKPVLIIKNDAGELVAFNATCKHLGCTVQFLADKNHIFCGCHGGTYDLTGKNIAGPPPAPLDKLKVTVSGEDVIVSKA